MPARTDRSALVSVVLAVALASVSCGGRGAGISGVLPINPTEGLPAKFKSQEPVPKPDFSVPAESPAFQQAIKDATTLLGAQPQPLRTEGENDEVKGGVSFDVPRKKAEALLLNAHTDFLSRGFYLFRYDENFDIQGRPDKVGLLPTTDFYAVIAVMQTNGDNYSIGTDGVIAWMKELQQEQPFILTGIGFDYLEGRFTGPVKDPEALAKRMYQFCPDVVDQGAGSIDALEKELQKGTLYFWWD
jgi:Domain of unknown function (DUF4253)